jgi:hypothetical protein
MIVLVTVVVVVLIFVVSMDLWLCWFLVVHGGFHAGADFGSFVAELVVIFGGGACGVFGGAARGGWCCF